MFFTAETTQTPGLHQIYLWRNLDVWNENLLVKDDKTERGNLIQSNCCLFILCFAISGVTNYLSFFLCSCIATMWTTTWTGHDTWSSGMNEWIHEWVNEWMSVWMSNKSFISIFTWKIKFASFAHRELWHLLRFRVSTLWFTAAITDISISLI